MSKLEAKQFDAPDEVRPFSGHGRVDLLQLGTGDVTCRHVQSRAFFGLTMSNH